MQRRRSSLRLYNEHTPLCILIRHKGRGYPKDSQTFVALFSVFLVFFCDFQWFRLSASPLAMIISRLRRLRIGLINRLPPRDGSATPCRKPVAGRDDSATPCRKPVAGRDGSATPCRKPVAGRDGSATPCRKPVAGRDGSATPCRKPVAGREDSATPCRKHFAGARRVSYTV